MGPRGLNTFFKKTRPNGITETSLFIFRGKTIVIDVSIYLYRYNTNNELFENFYAMLNIFKVNKITPLFVFDGPPPPEKYDTINKRKDERREAEREYNELLQNSNVSKKELERLQRKKTTVSYNNRIQLKKLLDYYGAMYVDAENEADELCAHYVISGKAWACLSDDMDMFLYGCPRILRYFSILNETVMYYNLCEILTYYNMNHTDFVKLCVLSGTDYNNRIYNIEELFDMYKRTNNFNINNLIKDKEILMKIVKGYCERKYLIMLDKITTKAQDKSNLITFLENYNFVFVN